MVTRLIPWRFCWLSQAFPSDGTIFGLLILISLHNLLSDPFENDFDLIVCRNVVIYLVAEPKDRLYRGFRDALRPDGVLFLGDSEVLFRPLDRGFQPVGSSFYHRTVE